MSVTILPGMNVPSGGVGGGRRLGFYMARGRLDGDFSSSSDSLEETKSMTDEEDGEVATGGLSAVSIDVCLINEPLHDMIRNSPTNASLVLKRVKPKPVCDDDEEEEEEEEQEEYDEDREEEEEEEEQQQQQQQEKAEKRRQRGTIQEERKENTEGETRKGKMPA